MTVGLTGGIGSGKTTVANLLETLGCIIYNSDDKAKELYFKPSVKTQIIQLLGNQAYLNDSKINKKHISEIIFSNTDILKQLNNIIHPEVKEDFINFKSKYSSQSILIKETALLFEAGLYRELDYCILITAPLELKIDRIMKRNATSIDEIKKRILTQWPDERKIPLADFIIINDNSQALLPQVLQIIEQLKKNA